jgi:hypothetical protein
MTREEQLRAGHDAAEKAKAEAEAKTPKVVKRLVKVRALRPVADHTGRIFNPGSELEVEESMVAELTKPRHEGPYAFSGQRHQNSGDCVRANLQRAELVA